MKNLILTVMIVLLATACDDSVDLEQVESCDNEGVELCVDELAMKCVKGELVELEDCFAYGSTARCEVIEELGYCIVEVLY